ncbi:hypothetical protein [Brachybacterium hainanense]|uniref:Histidine kinase n=1 Tax=Brachybacterium hainanense TaxID=1541174 RepID=A0ABV6RGT1_9MICO
MSAGPRQDAAPPAPDAAGRIMQCVLAGVIALISVGLMVSLHRLSIDVLGLALPLGLVLGGLFQTVASIFLLAVTGSRLPVLVLACVWGIAVMPLAGAGAGGGVLMPAVIGGRMQVSGWIVQGLGVLIPFLVALAVTLLRRRRR